MRYITLKDKINNLVDQHGSLRAVAEELDIDVGFLSRLRSGKAINPGKEILYKLGLEKFILYKEVGE